MRARLIRATAPILAAVALVISVPTPVSADGAAPLLLLDVPFLAQHDALCGGASLAMVLRYWGDDRALPDDFVPLLTADRSGIVTDDLRRAAAAAGCEAFAVTGDTSWVAHQLDQGRPVIALIRTGRKSFHYVVLVGRERTKLVLHDPAVGPFRVRDLREFDRDWHDAGRWALLVVPAATETVSISRAAPPPLAAATAGDSLVRSGIALAQAGQMEAAEARFRAASLLDPAAPSPLREWAGVRFRADDFAGAIDLARQATDRAPADTLSWRIAAGSAFLIDDVDGALDAWNRIGEPEPGVTTVHGLVRTRQPAVEEVVGLRSPRPITASQFRLSRRRLGELPALSGSRLELRPRVDGRADLDASVVERPGLLDGRAALMGLIPPALIDQEIRTGLTSPTGQGERFDLAWRWSKNRPRIALGVRVPNAFGIRGIWSAFGMQEKEAYASERVGAGGDSTNDGIIREERHRAELAWSDWIDPLARLGFDAAFDRWNGRGSFLSAGFALTLRAAQDRLGFGGDARGWLSLDGQPGFGAVHAAALWRSARSAIADGWTVRGEASWTGHDAPYSLWSGAGTGLGRPPLLRAHPLLDDGIVTGPVFGRTLLQGTIERTTWPFHLGPLRAGGAAFLDAARSGPAAETGAGGGTADAGLGLRFGWPGGGTIRIDRAWGLSDDAAAWSIGWEETLLP